MSLLSWLFACLAIRHVVVVAFVVLCAVILCGSHAIDRILGGGFLADVLYDMLCFVGGMQKQLWEDQKDLATTQRHPIVHAYQ